MSSLQGSDDLLAVERRTLKSIAEVSTRGALESGPPEGSPGTLRLGEAARLAGVCTRTIRRWVQAGRLRPAATSASREKRYRRADVERIARLRGTRRPPPGDRT
jgi:hypothetical protein